MNEPAHSVIAIDGPAASGKSSVSRALADQLGYVHVNSGAMYRALAWSALGAGVDVNDAVAVSAHLDQIDVICGVADGNATLEVNGVDPGAALKSPEVNGAVSAVAKIAEVRTVLVAKQREYANVADIVMEGRDIGSVVFAETPYKFYIDASSEVRAARRKAEGIDDDLARRDAIDSARKASPLVIPEDAIVIDTSEMNLTAVVDAVLEGLRQRGLAIEK